VQPVRVGRLSVPVASAEDLIVLKAVAHRHIDQADIAKLLDLCEDLDFAYIRKHVDALSQALEMPEIFEDLDQSLREYEKPPGRKKKGPG
jgi:predicted nucleotidyltransferase